jgi:hypothetical protein
VGTSAAARAFANRSNRSPNDRSADGSFLIHFEIEKAAGDPAAFLLQVSR